MISGSIGLGYFIYGKKQKKGVAFLAGVGLCVFPYFTSSFLIFILVAFVLMSLPFIFKY